MFIQGEREGVQKIYNESETCNSSFLLVTFLQTCQAYYTHLPPVENIFEKSLTLSTQFPRVHVTFRDVMAVPLISHTLSFKNQLGIIITYTIHQFFWKYKITAPSVSIHTHNSIQTAFTCSSLQNVCMHLYRYTIHYTQCKIQ